MDVTARDLPDEVDQCLERWAHFTRGGYESLGYSERTIIARLMEEGPIAGAYEPGPGLSGVPDDVVDVDRAIARLPSRYRKVLKAHYCTKLPPRYMARQMGLSPASYYLRLNAAKVGICMSLNISCV